MSRTVCVLAAAGLAAAWVAGCEDGKAIELAYQRPAAYQISPTVKRVGIAEFGGATAQERQWGSIASDLLASALDEYNRKYHRYELVDRKRLKAILDERDLQLAIADASSAGEAGKLAKVDAMVYGSVKVTTRDDRGTRKVFDPIHRSLKTVSYVRRYCLTAVNFTLVDIGTSKTLASVSASREYDSEKDDKKGAAAVGKALGFSGGDLPPADQVVNNLIGQCVQEFLAKISPHDVVVAEKLQGGKSPCVETGNKLALAGDYAEALEVYETAIKLNAADHGAVFNAGLMHEALGHLEKAEQYYDRAFRIEPKEQYVFARKRVRLETEQPK